MFFTVVLFGLFHGLVYLPVVLSWLGPEPYHTSSVHTSPRRQLEVEKASNGHVEGSKLLDQVSVRSRQSTMISCYVKAMKFIVTISIRTKIVAWTEFYEMKLNPKKGKKNIQTWLHLCKPSKFFTIVYQYFQSFWPNSFRFLITAIVKRVVSALKSVLFLPVHMIPIKTLETNLHSFMRNFHEVRESLVFANFICRKPFIIRI